MPEEEKVVVNMPQKEPVDYSYMITTVAAWSEIIKVRLLTLLALIGALVLFSMDAYDPLPQRTLCASLYAIGVLWPMIALFSRKG